MKKLALLLPAMRMGGAEKIVLNFLHDLIQHYDVTLILNKMEGELLPLVPQEVRILEDRLLTFSEVIKDDLKHVRIIKLLKDFRYYMRVKCKKSGERDYRYLIGRTQPISKEFDVAIGYVANVSTQIFSLVDRIKANKKIAWIHGETTELKDVELYTTCYKSFDQIFAVSNVTKQHFIEKFPECAAFTDVYYNRINSEEIINLAQKPMANMMNSKRFNIVSVGRVTPEKGFNMLPEIVVILKQRGHDIHWFLIGDGTELESIKNKAKNLQVEDNFTFLGMQQNPYPYIKNGDIYVQPSYEEGYSTTICEAGILGKAIVGTTTSGGIREQVENGESVLLADPTPKDLAAKIEILIYDPLKRRYLENQISAIDFSNKDEICKLVNFLDNY